MEDEEYDDDPEFVPCSVEEDEYDDDEYDDDAKDEDGEHEEAELRPAPKDPAKDPRAGSRGMKYQEPMSDNDPSEVDEAANDYTFHPPDTRSWTRNYKRV